MVAVRCLCSALAAVDSGEFQRDRADEQAQAEAKALALALAQAEAQAEAEAEAQARAQAEARADAQARAARKQQKKTLKAAKSEYQKPEAAITLCHKCHKLLLLLLLLPPCASHLLPHTHTTQR